MPSNGPARGLTPLSNGSPSGHARSTRSALVVTALLMGCGSGGDKSESQSPAATASSASAGNGGSGGEASSSSASTGAGTGGRLTGGAGGGGSGGEGGEFITCYTGPPATLGVGSCKAGVAMCNDQGTGLGPCLGDVTPAPESCATPVDDNCDGQINESCARTPGSVASCYSGPAGTQGVGVCKAGIQTCNAQGTAYGACTGEVLPAPESWATQADDNCDGQVNEGCL